MTTALKNPISTTSITPIMPPQAITVVTGATFRPTERLQSLKGCCVQAFGITYTLNASAALAIQALQQGELVILALPAEQVVGAQVAMEGMGLSSNLALFAVGAEGAELAASVRRALASAFRLRYVSRVNFVLHGSYSEGTGRPFAAMDDIDPQEAADVGGTRIKAWWHLLQAARSVLNETQAELRIVGLTALAAHRPSSFLFIDSVHKVVSSVMLEVFALENSTQERPVYVVEVGPGIVSSSTYDRPDIQQLITEEAKRDGFPLDPGNLPQLQCTDVARVAAAYLRAIPGTAPEGLGDVEHLTWAGRTPDDFLTEIDSWCLRSGSRVTIRKNLPAYVCRGTTFGGFPCLLPGYSFIPLTPLGQRF